MMKKFKKYIYYVIKNSTLKTKETIYKIHNIEKICSQLHITTDYLTKENIIKPN